MDEECEKKASIKTFKNLPTGELKSRKGKLKPRHSGS